MCCSLSRFCLTDLVLYCEAFLTTYRTFITPEDLIKKLHYRYPFQEAQHVAVNFVDILPDAECLPMLCDFTGKTCAACLLIFR